MKKSMSIILLATTLITFTGCNSSIKTTERKLESTYNIQLDYEKQNGSYIITSADFCNLSEPDKYDVLLSMYNISKEIKGNYKFGIQSGGDFYSADFTATLPYITINDTKLYSRSLTADKGINPLTEAQMIDVAKSKIDSDVTGLLVRNNIVSGVANDKFFSVVFDATGNVTDIYYK